MFRKNLAALLRFSVDFGRQHRFLTLILALPMLAAVAGALYLLTLQVPRLMSLPCFTHFGGCGR